MSDANQVACDCQALSQITIDNSNRTVTDGGWECVACGRAVVDRAAELAKVEADARLMNSIQYREVVVSHHGIDRDALKIELDALRTFAENVIESTCWGVHPEDLDGGEIQDWALEHGLIRTVPGGFDPSKHHDASGTCDPGDTFYEFTREPEGATEETDR